MPKAISLDLRERVADAVLRAEESYPLIAERFCVSVGTVKRIAVKARAGESLEASSPPGRERKLGSVHLARIRAEIERDPYITSYELAARFNKYFPKNRVHRSTILRAMHELGFSFKKNTVRPAAGST